MTHTHTHTHTHGHAHTHTLQADHPAVLLPHAGDERAGGGVHVRQPRGPAACEAGGAGHAGKSGAAGGGLGMEITLGRWGAGHGDHAACEAGGAGHAGKSGAAGGGLGMGALQAGGQQKGDWLRVRWWAEPACCVVLWGGHATLPHPHPSHTLTMSPCHPYTTPSGAAGV